VQKVSYEAKVTRQKNSYLLLNKHGALSFFPDNFVLPFILVLFKELESNTFSVMINDQLLIISYFGRARCLGLMLRARLLRWLHIVFQRARNGN